MDLIFRNVFSLSKPKSFDLGSYSKGDTRTVTFPTAGVVSVYCHLHPNLTARLIAGLRRRMLRAAITCAMCRPARTRSSPGTGLQATLADRCW